MTKLGWLGAVLGVAIVLGGWVRTNGAQARWVWQDEAVTLLHVAGRTGTEVDAGPKSRTFGELRTVLSVPAPGGAAAVVAALAADDPQHPPAYYVAQRLWNDAHGDALGRRSLAILFGVLAVAAIAWFAGVLGGVRAAAIAAALAAVSPFLVLYGQQLREYGLWCALVAASSAALVAAARRGGATRWFIYAVASALALWTSPLSLLLVPAHAVYAGYAGGRRALTFCALAYVGALVAYAPWIGVMIAQRHAIADSNSWSATPYSPLALAAKVLFTLSSAFTDLAYANPRGVIASAVVLLLVAGAAVYLTRTDRDAAVALGSLALSTAGTLIVLDLLGGTHRAASSRYLAPLIVVAIVAVACALARLPQRAALALTAVLVALGAYSSALGTTAPVWWDNHGDSSLLAVAGTLARAGAAPLLFEGPCSGLLGLARVAPPAEPVRCAVDRLGRGDAGDYVLSPTPGFVARARAAGLAAVPAADAHDASDAVRAFRRRAGRGDDEPTLARLEPIRPNLVPR